MQDIVERQYRLLFGILLASIVILAFYVGMLQGRQGGTPSVILSCTDEVLQKVAIQSTQMPTTTQDAEEQPVPSSTAAISTTAGAFAGSKNGTKYYTPGCAGLNRIKSENVIWFKDAQDATLQGYTPANC